MREFTITETKTIRIETIYTVEELCRALRQVGSLYMSDDNRRFFGSRVVNLWTTDDGAILHETIKAGFDGGRAHKVTRFRFGAEYAGGHKVETIYSGLKDTSVTAATQGRRAVKAALAARG